MKTLFVRLPQDRKTLFHIMPPLGLGYLSSSLSKSNLNIEVNFIDCVLNDFSYKDLFNAIRDLEPNVICFTVYTHDLDSIKIASSYIKENISRKVVIIVGGPHPSVAPRHTLDYLESVDFAFKGESEIGLPILIKYLMNNNWKLDTHDELLDQIPGLARRGDGNCIKINKQIFVEDLDSLGFPDWKLLNPRKYFKTCQGVFFKSNLFAPMFATRGCPQYCGFCAANHVMGRKIRKRSVGHIIEEILFLKHEFQIKEFHFLDDNFTSDRSFIISFCKEISKRNIDIFWCCPNGIRIDSVDEEMLDFMKKSGCYSISLGIESGSQVVLDRMNKGLKIHQIRSSVNLIKSKDFDTTGFFIIGYPGETKNDMRETIDFAKSLPIDVADISNFIPLPGTVASRDVLKDGCLEKKDFGRFSSPSYVADTSLGFSYKKMQKKMIRRAYLEFYLRPRILVKLLLRIKNKYQIYFILKRIFAYLVFQ
jgi:anaerobic magnesium-protoporphyrin IX monomethyl ester cyclase